MNPVQSAARDAIDKVTHVTVRDDEISAFADTHKRQQFETNEYPGPRIAAGEYTVADIVDLVVVGNAINFQVERTNEQQSPILREQELWSELSSETGTDGVSILDGETLASISQTTVERVLNPEKEREIPAIEERCQHLQDIGEAMLWCDGTFLNLFANRENIRPFERGIGFAGQLVEISGRAYDDSQLLDEAVIPFHSRAQQSLRMIDYVFQDVSGFALAEPNSLTVAADDVLPAIMRELDILSYDQYLQNAIRDGSSLSDDSRLETEIRLATVVAGERIRQALTKRFESPIATPQVERYLRYQATGMRIHPHQTETTAY